MLARRLSTADLPEDIEALKRLVLTQANEYEIELAGLRERRILSPPAYDDATTAGDYLDLLGCHSGQLELDQPPAFVPIDVCRGSPAHGLNPPESLPHQPAVTGCRSRSI
jgi:hypothetical protein